MLLKFEDASPILEAVGIAGAADEPLDVGVLATEVNRPADAVASDCHILHATGLALFPHEDEPADPPLLTQAGSQYLRLEGAVSDDCLVFLPSAIDDLHARQAMLHAGTVLVDEFGLALAQGDGVRYARELVPPAFEGAVDPDLAIHLFAAAVALLARLSADHPAGCTAEEILGVRLMEHAGARLQIQVDEGEITEAEAEEATEALRGLFDHFDDDDVLKLFSMVEPADASVSGHHDVSRQMGVVDQRLEAWFRPFGGVPATGHLDERER